MRILLDTRFLLWWLGDADMLPGQAFEPLAITIEHHALHGLPLLHRDPFA